tara:strand:+ start:175 stop:408 length:234 start_codon:yes stop_codon:yes gene_type:complete
MYKNIIISALRARQIIDDRYEKLIIEEDIEDSEQLDAIEIEEENIDYEEKKPITMAVDEFMNKEFDWRKADEDVIDE